MATGSHPDISQKPACNVVCYRVDSGVAESLNTMLVDAGYQPGFVNSEQELQDSVNSLNPAAIVFGYFASQEDVSREILEAKKLNRYCPLICLSDRSDIEARMRMMRNGVDAYFTLPFDGAGFLAKLDEIIELNRKRTYVVTIVDDDEDYSNLTGFRLSKAGFKVNVVNDPEKLLDCLSREKPDVILMDLYLPEYGGEELTRMLRQNMEYEDIPIIYLSAETDYEKQMKAINYGGDDFITKPFKKEHLVKAIVDRIRRSIRDKSRLKNASSRSLDATVSNKYELFNRIRECDENCKGSLIYIEIRELSDEDRHRYIFYIDDIMKEIAARVRAVSGMRYHARLSDSALGVLSEIENESDLKACLSEMTDSLDREYHTSEKPVKARIVIGATLVSSSEDYHDVLVDAHRSCDFAWRNRQPFHIYQSKQEKIVDDVNAEWEGKIHTAIKEDKLVLHFQPIVTIHGAHEEKYDVMVRLSDEGNMVFEAQRFIPAAEATGMIRPIDDWVMHQSLHILKGKREKNPETVFFIKLSVSSIADDSFISDMLMAIEQENLPPSSIVVEFLQKDASSMLGLIRTNLERLASNGIKLAIEHFGADLSSSDLLEALPVDYIKIDGAFMCDLTTNHANLSTVKTLADMATSKGVQSIATYVENADSLALLWNSGVSYTQGNFLRQPEASLDYDFPEQ